MAKLIVGVDEVGLGCLAGPVVVAAVVFPEKKSPIDGLADSKALTHNRRSDLSSQIVDVAPFWAIALSGVPLINKHGIARCHRDCIQAAVHLCRQEYPDCEVILDGNKPVHQLGHHRCVVKADTKIPAVSAASIIAKVYRDNLMVKLARLYPRYDWENNKGYGTKAHVNALERYGVTKHHRRAYAPIRQLLGE